MSADQSRLHLDEVPLRGGSLQHIVRVDSHGVEDLRQLVHESDIHVPLRVLYDFASLRYPYGWRPMGTIDQDRSINLIDKISHLRGGAGSHLLDLIHRMLPIARIDSLRRIARKEILVERQAGNTLDHRDALVLRHAWIDRGFIDHHIPFANHLPHRLARRIERNQIGGVIRIDGSGNRHNIKVTVPNILQVRCAHEAPFEGSA